MTSIVLTLVSPLISLLFTLAMAILPHPLRSPKPSLRPPGVSVIHSGDTAYEPTDDDCADECHAVSERFVDECLELCAEEQ